MVLPNVTVLISFFLKQNVLLFFRETWNAYFIFRELWKDRFIFRETWSRPPPPLYHPLLWSTLIQKFMNFCSFLTRSGDKHDEEIRNCTSTCQAGPSSQFCCESHDFVTFVTAAISQKCQLLLLNRDSSHVNAAQRHQQETSRLFFFVGHFKCDEMSLSTTFACKNPAFFPIHK